MKLKVPTLAVSTETSTDTEVSVPQSAVVIKLKLPRESVLPGNTFFMFPDGEKAMFSLTVAVPCCPLRVSVEDCPCVTASGLYDIDGADDLLTNTKLATEDPPIRKSTVSVSSFAPHAAVVVVVRLPLAFVTPKDIVAFLVIDPPEPRNTLSADTGELGAAPVIDKTELSPV